MSLGLTKWNEIGVEGKLQMLKELIDGLIISVADLSNTIIELKNNNIVKVTKEEVIVKPKVEKKTMFSKRK